MLVARGHGPLWLWEPVCFLTLLLQPASTSGDPAMGRGLCPAGSELLAGSAPPGDPAGSSCSSEQGHSAHAHPQGDSSWASQAFSQGCTASRSPGHVGTGSSATGRRMFWALSIPRKAASLATTIPWRSQFLGLRGHLPLEEVHVMPRTNGLGGAVGWFLGSTM